MCLTQLEVEVTKQADIAFNVMLELAELEKCCHSPQTALRLMRSVLEYFINGWSGACQLGWCCFGEILGLAEKESNKGYQSQPLSPQPSQSPFNIDEDEYQHSDMEGESESVPSNLQNRCPSMAWLRLRSTA